MLFLFNLNFFFFIFFFLLFWMSLYLYLYDLVYLLVYNFFFLNSCDFSLVILFDWMSVIFLSIVFLISGCVFLYSLDYMSGDNYIIRFYFLVFLFVLSMFMLIMMPDLICLMLGWDGLGLVSYCLVIYYQSNLSLSSGYLTLFMNRLGDLFLIFCICWCFNYGCWHYIYLLTLKDYSFLMFMFLLLASLTKSAQFPFSSWLPAAMAAPTPVSSLVHSSTLVTAGVYLLIRFNIMITGGFNLILINLTLLTILLSGFGALYENDLSKIIAFSTMGQLSFMIFVNLMGCYYLSFIHLLIHAVFKSLLFLCSGVFISGFMGVQDIRFMGNLTLQSPLISSCFMISLFSLCGLPFYSGFFSSDLIVELTILSNLNFFYLMIFFFSIYLTLIYSLRLFFFLYIYNMNMNFFNLIDCFYMKVSCLFLLFFSVVLGSGLFWIMDNMYIYVFDWYYKYVIIYFFFYFIIFFNSFNLLNFNLFKFMYFFFGNMWFLPFFSSVFVLSKFYSLGSYLFMLIESSWTEYLISLSLINFLKLMNLYMNSFMLNSLKSYLISFIFFLLLMLIF
uniref:NADH-ubiquinone oxidoreductase chain 5 n=1 Tax=Perkinsiella saccharicida TaxID=312347 RepID=A0A7S4YZ68_9HEMI|nr:NADH dehydrogenase subunit 5 [Perkinsiella saccharicida]QBZ38037.1 NADH dehydrogenase subunit 5 [Perkinsiella saccharicida]